MKIAKYKCLKCNREFDDKPGPTECPYRCLNPVKYDNHDMYITTNKTIKWLNYEQLRKEGKLD